MRATVSDRYAAKIWLPCLAGAISLATFFLDHSDSRLRLVLAIGWFVIAAAAYWERRRKQDKASGS
jgi:hypothetical protein